MTFFRYSFLLSILVILTGCGITQPIRPIEEGTAQVIASFGGPIIPFAGISIPIPYLNVGAIYGYRPNLTLYGNAHITALLYKDVGVDAGFSSRLIPEKGFRPEVTINGRAYFFWDAFRENTMRLYPTGTLTGSYMIGDRSLWYFGVDNLYQFTTSELFLAPFVGYGFPLGESTMMQMESKWMAMNHDTRHGIFEGVASVAGKGNIGIFVGLQYEIK
ncbi:MAG: hypothetical protein WCX28_01140 [Bacteriovoracaceae bacterium]|nr:hypothetical protein [Bacteroidota bacterium]